jgi:hypothetical protein
MITHVYRQPQSAMNRAFNSVAAHRPIVVSIMETLTPTNPRIYLVSDRKITEWAYLNYEITHKAVRYITLTSEPAAI